MMKKLLIAAILMAILLPGCGNVHVKTFHEDGTPAWDVKEMTFGKNLTGVNAEVKTGDNTTVSFNMDGSSVEVQMVNMILQSQQALMQALLATQAVVPVQ